MGYRSLLASEEVQQRRRSLLLRAPLVPTSHGLTNSLFVSASRRVEEEDKSITDALAAILSHVPVASDVTKQEKSPPDVRQKAMRVTSAGAKRQRQQEDKYYMGFRSARLNPNVQKILRTRNPQVDDHFWKKYGQKNIHGATHPRSYFKCTQSQDQGCEAKKQVQLDEDSSTFLVTYIGKHTCQRFFCTSQPLYDDIVVGEKSFMISFDSYTNPKSLSSSVEACTKQSHELRGRDCNSGFYESLGCKKAKEEEEVITRETAGSVITSTKSPEVDSSDFDFDFDFDFDMSDETKMLVENILSELVVHSCV